MAGELGQQLAELFEERRSYVRATWHRDLPTLENLADRWERARRLGFGEGASIYDTSFVFGDVSVGENTWVGPFVMLDGSGGIAIGRNCSISTGVQIYSHDSVRWALSSGRAGYEYAPVAIGDCCYLAPNVVVARGIHIGDHSVVATASFVNRDVPPYSIAAGSPARVIGRVLVKGDEVELLYEEQGLPAPRHQA